ncbi:MAG: type II secretion system protein [Gammaproteobacteria bacterium]|nr:type II secretion system protein [Gammaproteobacteria bacterium]
MNKANGFTLIELVVVIVILGILAVTALPKFIDISTDAHIATLKSFAGTFKSTSQMVHLKQVIENDVSGDASEGINLFGIFIQTSYGYIDGGSAGDFLSVLQGDVAIGTNLSSPCNDDAFCLNSRSASSGYPGLTLPSTDGSIVIVFPKGYTRNESCFAYYWFSQQSGDVPVVGVISTGC